MASPRDEALSLDGVKIPRGLGHVESIHAGNSGKTVFLIQDAHAIPEAQRTIRGLSEYLAKEYGVSRVGVEGASGKLEPGFLRSFPDPKRLKEVIREYDARGEITGAVAGAVFGPEGIVYQGIEDWPLYEEGIRLFLKTQNQAPGAVAGLKWPEEDLELRKKELYSKELYEIDRALTAYREKQISLFALLKALAAIRPPAKDSMISLLLGAIEKEANPGEGTESRVEALAEEFRKAIEALPRQKPRLKALRVLNRACQEYRTGQRNPDALAFTLLRLKRKYLLSPRLSRDILAMAGREERLRAIQGPAFFNALEQYTAEVKTALFRNEEEKKLDRKSFILGLAKRLMKLELTRQEWQAWENLSPEDSLPLDLKSSLGPAEEFYRNAEKRDLALRKNLERFMKQDGESSAAVIAGGFHTEGLLEEFKKRGFSCAVIVPKISRLPEQDAYQDHMRGEVSWKQYFPKAGDSIVPGEAFLRAIRDRLLDEAGAGKAALMKSWRDQIIRDLADRGRIEEAGNFTWLLDESAEKFQAGQGRPLPGWAKGVERFVRGLRELESRGRFTPENILHLVQKTAIISYGAGNAVLTTDLLSSDPRIDVPAPLRAELRSGESVAQAFRWAELLEGVDPLQVFGWLPDDQLEAQSNLALFPAGELIRNLETLDPQAREYRLSVIALGWNASLQTYQQVRELYFRLDPAQDRAKRSDIVKILRRIQFRAVLYPGAGDGRQHEINRRTWEGRSSGSFALIDEEVNRLLEENSGITIGDFAVSDGTSTYELALRYQDRPVKVVGYDKVTHFHPVRGQGYVWIFDNTGKIIQLLVDGSPVFLGIETLREPVLRMEEVFSGLTAEQRENLPAVSLINPEAEEYARQNPDKLEFRAHDVFHPLEEHYEIIRVLGLLMRGPYSYFSDEKIRDSLGLLGASLPEGGMLMNGTFWQSGRQFDLYFRRGGTLVRDDRSSGFADNWGWETIELGRSEMRGEESIKVKKLKSVKVGIGARSLLAIQPFDFLIQTASRQFAVRSEQRASGTEAEKKPVGIWEKLFVRGIHLTGWAGVTAALILSFWALPMRDVLFLFVPVLAEGLALGFFMGGLADYKEKPFRQIWFFFAGLALFYVHFHKLIPWLEPEFGFNQRGVTDIAVSLLIRCAAVFTAVMSSKWVRSRIQAWKVQRAGEAVSPVVWKTETLKAVRWTLGAGIAGGYFVYYVFYNFLHAAIPEANYIASLDPELATSIMRAAFDLSIATMVVFWLFQSMAAVAFGEGQTLRSKFRGILFFTPLAFVFWAPALVGLWYFFPDPDWKFQIVHALVFMTWAVILENLFGSPGRVSPEESGGDPDPVPDLYRPVHEEIIRYRLNEAETLWTYRSTRDQSVDEFVSDFLRVARYQDLRKIVIWTEEAEEIDWPGHTGNEEMKALRIEPGLWATFYGVTTVPRAELRHDEGDHSGDAVIAAEFEDRQSYLTEALSFERGKQKKPDGPDGFFTGHTLRQYETVLNLEPGQIRRELEALAKNQSEVHILDAAAGSGRALSEIADFGLSNVKLHGYGLTDFGADHPAVGMTHGDILEIGRHFPPESMDFIFLVFQVAHGAALLETMEKLFRLLKPGGVLRLTYDHPRNFLVEENGIEEQIYLAREFLKIAKSAGGFRIIRDQENGSLAWDSPPFYLTQHLPGPLGTLGDPETARRHPILEIRKKIPGEIRFPFEPVRYRKIIIRGHEDHSMWQVLYRRKELSGSGFLPGIRDQEIRAELRAEDDNGKIFREILGLGWHEVVASYMPSSGRPVPGVHTEPEFIAARWGRLIELAQGTGLEIPAWHNTPKQNLDSIQRDGLYGRPGLFMPDLLDFHVLNLSDPKYLPVNSSVLSALGSAMAHHEDSYGMQGFSGNAQHGVILFPAQNLGSRRDVEIQPVILGREDLKLYPDKKLPPEWLHVLDLSFNEKRLGELIERYESEHGEQISLHQYLKMLYMKALWLDRLMVFYEGLRESRAEFREEEGLKVKKSSGEKVGGDSGSLLTFQPFSFSTPLSFPRSELRAGLSGEAAEILVVDDDPLQRESLEAGLNRLRGIKDVHTAAGAGEAIAKFHQNPGINFIVADFRLRDYEVDPDDNGAQVIKVLYQSGFEGKAMIVSADETAVLAELSRFPALWQKYKAGQILVQQKQITLNEADSLEMSVQNMILNRPISPSPAVLERLDLEVPLIELTPAEAGIEPAQVEAYSGKHVLIADDKPFIRDAFKATLRLFFDDILSVGTVEDAIDQIKAWRAAGVRDEDIIVLSDYEFGTEQGSLRRKDGRDLVNILRLDSEAAHEGGTLGFKGFIFWISGSIISKDEITGYDSGRKDILPEIKKKYGVDYLEKNTSPDFSKELVRLIYERLAHPYSLAEPVTEPLAGRVLSKPANISFLNGGVNDFEVRLSYAVNSLAAELALVPEVSGEEPVKAMIDQIRAFIDFGHVDRGYGFNQRVHNYKGRLFYVYSYLIPELKRLLSGALAARPEIMSAAETRLDQIKTTLAVASNYMLRLLRLSSVAGNIAMPVDLEAFERSTIGAFLEDYGAEIEIHTEIDGEGLRDTPLPYGLSFVVSAILDNARQQYGLKYPGQFKGTIEFKMNRDAETPEIVIRIQDNAGGIHRDALPKIFDRQFTTKAQGSGYGLFWARELVRRFGGEIAAQNAVDEFERPRGALFMIRVPLDWDQKIKESGAELAGIREKAEEILTGRGIPDAGGLAGSLAEEIYAFTLEISRFALKMEIDAAEEFAEKMPEYRKALLGEWPGIVEERFFKALTFEKGVTAEEIRDFFLAMLRVKQPDEFEKIFRENLPEGKARISVVNARGFPEARILYRSEENRLRPDQELATPEMRDRYQRILRQAGYAIHKLAGGINSLYWQFREIPEIGATERSSLLRRIWQFVPKNQLRYIHEFTDSSGQFTGFEDDPLIVERAEGWLGLIETIHEAVRQSYDDALQLIGRSHIPPGTEFAEMAEDALQTARRYIETADSLIRMARGEKTHSKYWLDDSALAEKAESSVSAAVDVNPGTRLWLNEFLYKNLLINIYRATLAAGGDYDSNPLSFQIFEEGGHSVIQARFKGRFDLEEITRPRPDPKDPLFRTGPLLKDLVDTSLGEISAIQDGEDAVITVKLPLPDQRRAELREEEGLKVKKLKSLKVGDEARRLSTAIARSELRSEEGREQIISEILTLRPNEVLAAYIVAGLNSDAAHPPFSKDPEFVTARWKRLIALSRGTGLEVVAWHNTPVEKLQSILENGLRGFAGGGNLFPGLTGGLDFHILNLSGEGFLYDNSAVLSSLSEAMERRWDLYGVQGPMGNAHHGVILFPVTNLRGWENAGGSPVTMGHHYIDSYPEGKLPAEWLHAVDLSFDERVFIELTARYKNRYAGEADRIEKFLKRLYMKIVWLDRLIDFYENLSQGRPELRVQDDNKTIFREILELSWDQVLRSYIPSIIRPGSNLYEEAGFVQTRWDRLIELSRGTGLEQLVWHNTPKKNLDSIMSEGLKGTAGPFMANRLDFHVLNLSDPRHRLGNSAVLTALGHAMEYRMDTYGMQGPMGNDHHGVILFPAEKLSGWGGVEIEPIILGREYLVSYSGGKLPPDWLYPLDLSFDEAILHELVQGYEKVHGEQETLRPFLKILYMKTLWIDRLIAFYEGLREGRSELREKRLQVKKLKSLKVGKSEIEKAGTGARNLLTFEPLNLSTSFPRSELRESGAGEESIFGGQRGERKLARIQRLLSKLERLLEERDASIRLTLMGVSHAHRIRLAEIPQFQNRDLVTLELPRQIGKMTDTENVFWKDVLDYYGENHPAWGLYGVNVMGETRSARRRAKYALDIYGERNRPNSAVLNFSRETEFSREMLGGGESGTLTQDQILERLPEALRTEFETKGIAVIPEEENPFGPKNLIVFKDPHPSVGEMVRGLRPRLEPWFEQYHYPESRRDAFVYHELIEPMFMVYNDITEVEEMLKRMNHKLDSVTERDRNYSALHIGGLAHNFLLEKFWNLKTSGRITVELNWEGRFMLNPGLQAFPGFLFRDLTGILSHIKAVEGEVIFDPGYFMDYLTRILSEEEEYFRKKIILESIWIPRQAGKGGAALPKETFLPYELVYYRDRYRTQKLGLEDLESLAGQVHERDAYGRPATIHLLTNMILGADASGHPVEGIGALNLFTDDLETNPYLRAHHASWKQADTGSSDPEAWIPPEDFPGESSALLRSELRLDDQGELQLSMDWDPVYMMMAYTTETQHRARFFRYSNPLAQHSEDELFDDFIEELVSRKEPGKKIRVLSAGASKGAEAYSIAIALLEQGVPPEEIEVVGIDAAEDMVRLAKEGVYTLSREGENFFTGILPVLLMKYFQLGDDSYAVKKKVKKLLRFQVMDIRDTEAMKRLGKFDGIACCNVFYQLKPEMRENALKNLGEVSGEGALLFWLMGGYIHDVPGIYGRDSSAASGFRHISRLPRPGFAGSSEPAEDALENAAADFTRSEIRSLEFRAPELFEKSEAAKFLLTAMRGPDENFEEKIQGGPVEIAPGDVYRMGADYVLILPGPAADSLKVLVKRLGPDFGRHTLRQALQGIRVFDIDGLRETTVTFGRNPASSIFLSSPTASRNHAVLRLQDGVFILEDAHSTHGTFRYREPSVLFPAGDTGQENPDLDFGRKESGFSVFMLSAKQGMTPALPLRLTEFYRVAAGADQFLTKFRLHRFGRFSPIFPQVWDPAGKEWRYFEDDEKNRFELIEGYTYHFGRGAGHGLSIAEFNGTGRRTGRILKAGDVVNATISKNQFALTVVGDTVLFRDLDSRHGTRIELQESLAPWIEERALALQYAEKHLRVPAGAAPHRVMMGLIPPAFRIALYPLNSLPSLHEPEWTSPALAVSASGELRQVARWAEDRTPSLLTDLSDDWTLGPGFGGKRPSAGDLRDPNIEKLELDMQVIHDLPFLILQNHHDGYFAYLLPVSGPRSEIRCEPSAVEKFNRSADFPRAELREGEALFPAFEAQKKIKGMQLSVRIEPSFFESMASETYADGFIYYGKLLLQRTGFAAKVLETAGTDFAGSETLELKLSSRGDAGRSRAVARLEAKIRLKSGAVRDKVFALKMLAPDSEFSFMSNEGVLAELWISEMLNGRPLFQKHFAQTRGVWGFEIQNRKIREKIARDFELEAGDLSPVVFELDDWVDGVTLDDALEEIIRKGMADSKPDEQILEEEMTLVERAADAIVRSWNELVLEDEEGEFGVVFDTGLDDIMLRREPGGDFGDVVFIDAHGGSLGLSEPRDILMTVDDLLFSVKRFISSGRAHPGSAWEPFILRIMEKMADALDDPAKGNAPMVPGGKEFFRRVLESEPGGRSPEFLRPERMEDFLKQRYGGETGRPELRGFDSPNQGERTGQAAGVFVKAIRDGIRNVTREELRLAADAAAAAGAERLIRRIEDLKARLLLAVHSEAGGTAPSSTVSPEIMRQQIEKILAALRTLSGKNGLALACVLPESKRDDPGTVQDFLRAFRHFEGLVNQMILRSSDKGAVQRELSARLNGMGITPTLTGSLTRMPVFKGSHSYAGVIVPGKIKGPEVFTEGLNQAYVPVLSIEEPESGDPLVSEFVLLMQMAVALMIAQEVRDEAGKGQALLQPAALLKKYNLFTGFEEKVIRGNGRFISVSGLAIREFLEKAAAQAAFARAA